MKQKILVVVDMQNDFVDGALGSEDAQGIIDNVIREIKSNEYSKIYVTLDSHNPDYLNTYEGKNLPVVHCIKGTDGWKMNSKVYRALKDSIKTDKTIDDKIVFYEKNGFGSFVLVNRINSEINNIESVTLVGLCTDICVMVNALMLRGKFPNLPIYYVEDACAATSKEKQDSSIKIFESCQIYPKPQL